MCPPRRRLLLPPCIPPIRTPPGALPAFHAHTWTLWAGAGGPLSCIPSLPHTGAFGACSEEGGARVLALTRGTPPGKSWALGVSTPPLPLSTDRLQLLRRRNTPPSSGVVGSGRGREAPAQHPRPAWPLWLQPTLTHLGGALEKDFLSLAPSLGARREWATLPQESLGSWPPPASLATEPLAAWNGHVPFPRQDHAGQVKGPSA